MATHRAWTGPEPLNHGERPDLHSSGQMNTPEVTYKVTSTKEAASSDPFGSPKTASDLRFYRLR